MRTPIDRQGASHIYHVLLIFQTDPQLALGCNGRGRIVAIPLSEHACKGVPIMHLRIM